MAYAHSKANLGPEAWHRLEDHLKSVADCARQFAAPYQGGDFAYLAGLWHDLGKYAPDWQEFLAEAGPEAPALGEDSAEAATPQGRRRGPDHSTAGACHARSELGTVGPDRFVGLVLQFLIAAHHAGLDDRQAVENRVADPDKKSRYARVVHQAPPEILRPDCAPRLPSFLAERVTSQDQKARLWRRFEMFVRMVFSALVDADFVDTEAFIEVGADGGGRPALRRAWRPLAAYEPVLKEHLRAFDSATPTPVNKARGRVLDWARAAAGGPRGAYTLTVPTGGGKTLSSLAFALRHADVHGLRRVVFALPFLSILDQTADVYRRAFESAFGDAVLVEHHSNVAPARDTRANRLASENWDAPLIVTTQVQLFESLFSNRPSHCRKLHNLAESVIVLDEVQTLPVELLAPILDQLQELRENYGVSLILTTATQPCLHSRELGPFRFQGLNPQPTEIVPPEETSPLFDSFRRVEVEWPGSDSAVDWASLAGELVARRQVLAVVHARRDARDLWQACEALAPGANTHLSAMLCPEHRRKVLRRVRDDLAAKRPCRVVSTQLVEAGVDVDFPVVYRAMAGLESLAQSAGRCNREGLLPEPGRFVIFLPGTEPPGLLRQHRDIARVMWRADGQLDPTRPETFRRYFDQLYATRNLDARGIQSLREGLRFSEVAGRFRMIDEAGETIFIPYGSAGRESIRDFRYGGPSRDRLRALQPFSVSVYPDALAKLRHQGAVELLHESVWVLVSDAHYHEALGLVVEGETGVGYLV